MIFFDKLTVVLGEWRIHLHMIQSVYPGITTVDFVINISFSRIWVFINFTIIIWRFGLFLSFPLSTHIYNLLNSCLGTIWLLSCRFCLSCKFKHFLRFRLHTCIYKNTFPWSLNFNIYYGWFHRNSIHWVCLLVCILLNIQVFCLCILTFYQ